MPWTKQQLIFVTTAYFTLRKSIVKAHRYFETEYQLSKFPSKKVIQWCVKDFSECGYLDKKKQPGRPCSATCQEKVLRAKQIVTADPNISTRRLSQQLDVSSKSAQRFIKRNLSMYPYKFQICQKLHDGDFERRGSCRRMKKTILLLEG